MERSKNVISEIPTSYGKISEYRFKKTKDKEKKNSLKIVSREELISTLEKCHQTVWQGGKLNPSDAFDEVSKILFCKLKDEKSTKLNEFYKFQIGTHEESKEVSNRIHKIYEEGKKADANVFSEDIKLDDEIIYKTVEHLQGININGTDLDSKGIAFERFMGDFFKGKMGQYFTPRNIVYFCVQMLDISEYERVLDPACGSGGFLLHAMDTVRKKAEKDFDDEVEIFKHWHDFASQRLFGIEINEQIARVCKMNMIIHDDGHTNVISADALDNIDKHHELNEKFIKESFDVILTNPPFGAKVLSNEKKYLGNYILGQNGNKVRAAQSTEILFIERCYEYLKEKGRMAIVLPDGILTNTTLQYVRDFIMEHFRINAIVSIPQTAFSNYGAGVKCSLLFLTKETVSEDYDIFMANAEDVGYDATGRKTDKNDLEEILKEYRKFSEKKNFKLLSKLCFLEKYSQINKQRLDPFWYSLNEIFFKSNKFENKILSELVSISKGNMITNSTKEDGDIPVIAGGQIPAYYNNKSNYDGNIITISASGAYSGYVWYHNYPIWASDCNVLQSYNKNINIKYIYVILKLNQDNIYKLQKGTAQPHVYASDIGNISIPIPPIEIQNKIANIIYESYYRKEELEKKASELLNSINDYVLNELDIKIDDSSKKEKCFTVKYSEIKNKRIDPFYIKFKLLLLNNSKYHSELLENILYMEKGITYDKNSEREKGIPVLRAGNITLETNQLNFDDIKYLDKELKLPDEKKLKKNDIFICTNSGSKSHIGKVAFSFDDTDYYFGGFMGVLRIKDINKYNPYYIFITLTTKYIKNLIELLIANTTINNINFSDIAEIPIPIPPIEIQNKIADEATNRREKAFKLQEEAKKIIEEAKKEVESILF